MVIFPRSIVLSIHKFLARGHKRRAYKNKDKCTCTSTMLSQGSIPTGSMVKLLSHSPAVLISRVCNLYKWPCLATCLDHGDTEVPVLDRWIYYWKHGFGTDSCSRIQHHTGPRYRRCHDKWNITWLMLGLKLIACISQVVAIHSGRSDRFDCTGLVNEVYTSR